MFVQLFLFVLGNVVLEPFSEDFQDHAFEGPSFSSWISKASYLGHIAPMSKFSTYSIE
jgi:hypothetical protein